MRAQLFNLIRDIRGSYWFVPSIMVAGAIVLAAITDWADANVDQRALDSIDWLFQSEAEGARAVLAAIATSMIGVAGVTFSMTLVAVSFAASNIGPRLIGNFMRDRGNQVTLGTFIATFVYCLLILRRIAAESPEAYDVPQIAVLVAMILAMISVSNLIYFIHHVPESINVANIAHSISCDLQAELERLFPATPRSDKQAAAQPLELDPLSPGFRVESQSIRADRDGYLQVIDMEAAIQIACKHDLMLRIEYRPGDFIVRASILAYAYPSAKVTPAVADAIADCVVIGSTRTRSQNVLFLINQLVEIMIRALSPGVNDPFTAIGCLDWLQAALTEVVQRPAPDQCHRDDEGRPRLFMAEPAFEQIAEATFAPAIQYAAADRTACLRLMEMIAELISRAEYEAYRTILLRHASAVAQAAETLLPVIADQERVLERYRQTVRMAHDPGVENPQRDSQDWLGGRG